MGQVSLPPWQNKWNWKPFGQLCANVYVTLAPWGELTRHLKVMRYDHKDGITWDELQAIKNDMLGPETTAVEVYPPASEIVDQINMRHLWEVPEGLVPSLYRGSRCRVSDGEIVLGESDATAVEA